MQLPQAIPGKLFASPGFDGDTLRHEVAVATNKKLEDVKKQEGDASINADLQKRMPHIAATTLVNSIQPMVTPDEPSLTVQRDSDLAVEGKTGRNINETA